MKKEVVYIGMPVFNGERHLAVGLESLLGQTYENLEILIGDNASTDRTPDIAREYARKDKRIHYARYDNSVDWRENWCRTYDLVVRKARFFMWASDDDLVARDYIECLLPPLLQNPQLVLSFSQADIIDETGRILGHLYQDIFPGGSSAFGRIRSIIRSGKFSAIYGLIRTQAVDWTPCLQDACFGSDLWFLLRLAVSGTFHMVKRPLFFKRIGGNSQTGSDPAAFYDPLKTWNIGDKEWNLIGLLNVSWITRLYTFYMLKILAKALYPQDKRIDWFLIPMFWCYMLGKNPRSFGLRSRLKKSLASK